MALVSAGVGYGLVRSIVAPRLETIVPPLAALSLLFGLWYTFNALGLSS